MKLVRARYRCCRFSERRTHAPTALLAGVFRFVLVSAWLALSAAGCGRATDARPPAEEVGDITYSARERVRELDGHTLRSGFPTLLVQDGGHMTFSMRNCSLHASGGTALGPATLDDFSIVLGSGALQVDCAGPGEAIRLRVVTCSGAIDIARGHVRITHHQLTTQITSEAPATFQGTDVGPQHAISLSPNTDYFFGVRGEVLTGFAETPAPSKYRSDLEAVVVATETALAGLQQAFAAGQQLTLQHAEQTRQGAQELATRTATELMNNARAQHLARERLRLVYARLMACDLAREQEHAPIARLSPAYAPRIAAEFALR